MQLFGLESLYFDHFQRPRRPIAQRATLHELFALITRSSIVVRSIVLLVSIASTAHAGNGVWEINQACAAGQGCFLGDSAGFPVQIMSSGSYRLTGNLIQPNPNTRMIEISGSSVSFDLNGFVIQGTNTYFGTSCSAPGSGFGVTTTNGATDVAISNGAVRGMGGSGVYLVSSTTSRVDRVLAEHNCGTGILVGNASLVTNSSAHYNRDYGFNLGATSRLTSCSALVNGWDGIVARESAVGIDGCVAFNNGRSGILIDVIPTRFGSTVMNSRAQSNNIAGIYVGTQDFINAYENGVLILRTSTTENGTYGILQGAGLGFNTSEANTIGDIFNPFQNLACNVSGGTRICP